MSWNHRVIEHTDDKGNRWWTIEEVMYNDKGEPYGHAEASAIHGDHFGGDPIESLREQLNCMLQALDAPILKEADINGVPEWEEELRDYMANPDKYKTYNTVDELMKSLDEPEEE